jgi:hypothetical protein
VRPGVLLDTDLKPGVLESLISPIDSDTPGTMLPVAYTKENANTSLTHEVEVFGFMGIRATGTKNHRPLEDIRIAVQKGPAQVSA